MTKKTTITQYYMLVNLFFTEHGLAILKLLYVYTRIEQLNKYSLLIMRFRFLTAREKSFK